MRWTYTQLPAAVVGMIGPWLLPFRSIDLINSRWRPEVDLVTDGIIVIFFVYLLAKYRVAPTPQTAERAFLWSIAGGVLFGVGCYFTKTVLIHEVDPDPAFLAPANLVWAAAYVVFFLFLARAVFFLLSWLTGRAPTPPGATP